MAEGPAGFSNAAAEQGVHLPSAPSAPCAAQALATAPLQQPLLGAADHSPSAPTMEPWEVGPQNMYRLDANLQALGIHDAFHIPDTITAPPADPAWLAGRLETLKDWGRRREHAMHRQPRCLMDQLVSGSNLYPPRLLDDSFFTPQEVGMVSRLERILEHTGHAHVLAKDMLTPLLYDIDVRIVLDNSGSMQLDMLGQVPMQTSGFTMGMASSMGGAGFNIEAQSPENDYLLQTTLQQALPNSWYNSVTRALGAGQNQRLQNAQALGALSPFKRRWFHAREAMRSWWQVYAAIGLDPPVYLLNSCGHAFGRRGRLSQLEEIFAKPPGGGTPMTEALSQAMADHRTECGSNRQLLLLVITDGEANNMQTFNRILDEAQNNVYGDVQICLMGLSLVKQDIEWFENEECDETRIRTVEAFEVEQRQIMLREVVRREGNYNFAMHTYRVLITNLFPADYDYEAPLQNLRHRLYITCHGRDRWWGLNNSLYWCLCSQTFCSACFVCSCAHGAGWCQGNDCGKCQKPELIEGCCGEE